MASAGADTLEMRPDATAGVCSSFLKQNLSRKENGLFYRQTVVYFFIVFLFRVHMQLFGHGAQPVHGA